MNENKLLINDLQRRWAEIGAQKSSYDLQLEIELYRRMFSIFQVGNSFFMIFNPIDSNIEYVSPNLEKVLGYSPDEFKLNFWLNCIHPDDFPYFSDIEDTVVDFKLSLPPDKLMKYKSRYDYRLKKSDGKYIRLMQQSITVQSTPEGEIIRNLVVYTDISHLKTNTKISLSFIGLDGEPSYFDVKTKGKYIQAEENLTLREKEIMKLLSQNYTSPEIAEILNISKYTVDTHRKHILSKTGTHNTLDLVLLAIDKGWV
ncbi:MAG: LuxR C-terminal-related transcriptional regulator [Weeksellaceae bacterium]|jgi:DNA-binding CsgD family transcriptional regulator|nr:LuxR C-terminal-related transcriptional regulator [Weeksellaceae bacterium]MDX9705874.1 LuxR C-terminal-related transcriptional regulator [Weeksellaceae bacterium]